MVSTLYDQTTAPGGGDRSNYNGCIAFRFAVSIAQYLRSVSIYQDSGSAPTSVEIYRTSTGTRVYHNEAVSFSGSTPGWRTWTLTSTQVSAIGVLLANTTYSLQINIGATGVHFRDGCDVPAAPDPWSYEGAFYGSYGSLNASSSSTGRWGFSAGVDSALPGGGGTLPATGGVVGENLSDWLDVSTGTQGNSAPLLDHATIGTINTNVSDVKAQQNEWAYGLGALAHGYFGLIKSLIDTIEDHTHNLPTFISAVTSIILDHYRDDIDNILAQVDSILAGLSEQSTTLSGTGGSAVGAISGRSAFPATGWSMTAETDFTDNVAFAEAGDAYVLTITSYQPTQPATTTAAGLWLPRIGWWCVLNGSLANQRRFVDFEEMILDDGGRRMPGCAIELKPGTLGHVQAWELA